MLKLSVLFLLLSPFFKFVKLRSCQQSFIILSTAALSTMHSLAVTPYFVETVQSLEFEKLLVTDFAVLLLFLQNPCSTSFREQVHINTFEGDWCGKSAIATNATIYHGSVFSVSRPLTLHINTLYVTSFAVADGISMYCKRGLKAWNNQGFSFWIFI